MVALGVGAAVNVGTDERREGSHAKEAVVALASTPSAPPRGLRELSAAGWLLRLSADGHATHSVMDSLPIIPLLTSVVPTICLDTSKWSAARSMASL